MDLLSQPGKDAFHRTGKDAFHRTGKDVFHRTGKDAFHRVPNWISLVEGREDQDKLVTGGTRFTL